MWNDDEGSGAVIFFRRSTRGDGQDWEKRGLGETRAVKHCLCTDDLYLM